MKKVLNTFSTTAAEREAWTKFAAEHGMGFSSLVRRAVRAYILERITPKNDE